MFGIWTCVIGRSVNFVEVMREPIMISHMMIILNLPYMFCYDGYHRDIDLHDDLPLVFQLGDLSG